MITEKDFLKFTQLVINNCYTIGNVKASEQEYLRREWGKKDTFTQEGYSLILGIITYDGNSGYEKKYDCDDENFTDEQIEYLNKKVIETVEGDCRDYCFKVSDLSSEVSITFNLNKSNLKWYGIV